MAAQPHRLAGSIAVVLLASAAPGQMDPTIFAQRCQVPELVGGLGGSDPCRMPGARLGLGGPTLVPAEGAGDVDVTGGISTGTADQASQREGTSR
ncbi:MAG TPA: hypothetical protein VHG30_02405 [Microvirga sp.]|nr:hypothetical protein [Microvirga sp.]